LHPSIQNLGHPQLQVLVVRDALVGCEFEVARALSLVLGHADAIRQAAAEVVLPAGAPLLGRELELPHHSKRDGQISLHHCEGRGRSAPELVNPIKWLTLQRKS
jgi:hypothetical protein